MKILLLHTANTGRIFHLGPVHLIFEQLQLKTILCEFGQICATTVQKLDVPGPDEKFCLCWLCAFTKFSSGGAIFPVHLIFEHL